MSENPPKLVRAEKQLHFGCGCCAKYQHKGMYEGNWSITTCGDRKHCTQEARDKLLMKAMNFNWQHTDEVGP